MMIQLNYAGFGYCQTSHDLQYRPRTEVRPHSYNQVMAEIELGFYYYALIVLKLSNLVLEKQFPTFPFQSVITN